MTHLNLEHKARTVKLHTDTGTDTDNCVSHAKVPPGEFEQYFDQACPGRSREASRKEGDTDEALIDPRGETSRPLMAL